MPSSIPDSKMYHLTESQHDEIIENNNIKGSRRNLHDMKIFSYILAWKPLLSDSKEKKLDYLKMEISYGVMRAGLQYLTMMAQAMFRELLNRLLQFALKSGTRL